jgi:hypothetical protein
MNTKIEIDIKVIVALVIGIILGAGGAIAAFGRDRAGGPENWGDRNMMTDREGNGMYQEVNRQGMMSSSTDASSTTTLPRGKATY